MSNGFNRFFLVRADSEFFAITISQSVYLIKITGFLLVFLLLINKHSPDRVYAISNIEWRIQNISNDKNWTSWFPMTGFSMMLSDVEFRGNDIMSSQFG